MRRQNREVEGVQGAVEPTISTPRGIELFQQGAVRAVDIEPLTTTYQTKYWRIRHACHDGISVVTIDDDRRAASGRKTARGSVDFARSQERPTRRRFFGLSVG